MPLSDADIHGEICIEVPQYQLLIFLLSTVKCRYCTLEIAIDWSDLGERQFENMKRGVHEPPPTYSISAGRCPQCDGEHIRLSHYVFAGESVGALKEVEDEILFPRRPAAENIEKVPSPYADDYEEATAIKDISPKGATLLARRISESVLENEHEIDDYRLYDQIGKFIKRDDIPAPLRQTADAVRELGNIGAHEQRDDAGERVGVEPDEADFVLSVVKQLFEHTFIRPAKHHEKVSELNRKLERIGRDPIQEPDD